MSETVRYEKTKHSGIRKRTWLASGEVTYQVRWTSKDGSRKSATRDTLREALDLRDEMHRQLRLGGSADPSVGRVTYGDNWERWFPTKEIKPSTRDTELSYFGNHIAPKWALVRVGDISAFEVDDWLTVLREQGLAASTRAKILRIFSQPIRQLVERGVLLSNPLVGITRPNVEDIEARFFEVEEWKRIEEAIHLHWRLVIPFIIDTGLRIGEAAALRVRDVDPVRQIVRVRLTASVDKGRRVENSPKSAAGKRVIPTLSRQVANDIAVMVEQRGLKPEDHLFTGPQGGLMTPSNWRKRVWYPAVEKAGIELPATPHALRHTAISGWIAAGADPLRVKTWSGHSSMAITYDRYGHQFQSDDDGVLQRLEMNRAMAAQ